MTRITHPEWRDQNENTPYPFADNATLVDQEGNEIPIGTFLDASIYPVGSSGVMHLSKISVSQDVATLWIGDAATETLCYGEVSLVQPDDLVTLFDAYDRPAGVLVSESLRLAVFQGWTQGEHLFDSDAAEFVPRVCHSRPEVGLTGILLDDGSLMTGDIWIVGDDGIIVREDEVEVRDGCDTVTRRVIRIDVVGDPLFKRRLCASEDLFTVPKFIQSIIFRRGCDDFEVTPDENGNINVMIGTNLAEDNVMRLRTFSGRGITFEAAGDTL